MSLTSLVKELFKRLFQLIGLFPVQSKLVIFESFLGKQYSDNPRAIYEYLKEHHSEYKLIWSVDSKHTAPFIKNQIPFVKRFSMKWLFLLPRAQYWVFNTRSPKWLPKPHHTTYLQTWHGTPLKKLGLDIQEIYMTGITTEHYKSDFKKETQFWDILISPNRYSTDIFKRAFHFNKEIIETGYPRNDYIILNNKREIIERLKYQLNLPVDKKVILYAPTWRDNEVTNSGKYKLDLQLDIALLQQALGDQYILILRLHYLIAEHLDLSAYEGFVYDFSKLDDIRELYLISDVLVTDYSSVFFDYANLKRPIIFFTYDIETYRDSLRGFYFDFENEAPGPLVKTTPDVVEAIKRFSDNDFKLTEKFKTFYNKFCYLEMGEATKKVIEKVFLR